MGLTSALFTTLTGLNANQSRLDVVGNNIANVNTIGFKSSRLDFETLFAETQSAGSPPGATSGGTNPFQVGMGVKNGAVTRDFNDGSSEVTGVNTDMAIQGNGFFIVQGDQQYFTRDGTFKLNSNNELVNADGYRVQGYGVDSGFNIAKGSLTNITIPLGTLTVAKATTAVDVTASLNGTGVVSTSPTTLVQNQNILGPAGAVPQLTDVLTGITDEGGTALFQTGDVINVKGTKGTNSVTPKSLTVTSTTTLSDYFNFIHGALGINTAASNGAAAAPGVSLTNAVNATASTPANARSFQIVGNLGSLNDITLGTSDITVTRGGSTLNPFTYSKTTTANGESAYTTATIYDSLGSPVHVNLTMALTTKDTTGTTWEFFAESPDDQRGVATLGLGTDTTVGTGTLKFDTSGSLVSSTGTTVAIDRTGTGAIPQLQFTLALDTPNALASKTSSLTATNRDGFAKGTLKDFAISKDGTIVGSFDNGERRTLGQVALATFRNNQGLVDAGNNTFLPGSNSGSAMISAPGEFDTGTIAAGTLEQSNVDLSGEFVRLISASTGFSASSRVITTSNQLLQELLSAAR